MKNNHARLVIIKFTLCACIVLTGSLFFFGSLQAQQVFPKIDPQNITIIRDSFGIPHIFAKTDAEVAYGLAWANDEDAFADAQNLIYIGHGFMGRKDGINGAKTDFFVHAIGARQLVEEHYE
jgi:acyl-homoserine-lactone acylase